MASLPWQAWDCLGRLGIAFRRHWHGRHRHGIIASARLGIALALSWHCLSSADEVEQNIVCERHQVWEISLAGLKEEKTKGWKGEGRIEATQG